MGEKPMVYKPTGNDTANTKSGPWAAKRELFNSQLFKALLTGIANTMGNGRDFFLELRKQMTAVQQGKGPSGG